VVQFFALRTIMQSVTDRQTDRQTERQTDGRQDDANSRVTQSHCVALRSDFGHFVSLVGLNSVFI